MRKGVLVILTLVALATVFSFAAVTAAKPAGEQPPGLDVIWNAINSLWANATEQQSAMNSEKATRISDDLALWANATEQQSAIDALSGRVTTLEGCDCFDDCNDSDACTMDVYSGGSCHYYPINCADDNACTVDACSLGTCGHTFNENNPNCCESDSECNDGNLCTDDACVASQCVFAPKCNDGYGCTVDTCDSTTGDCQNTRIPESPENPYCCNDNNQCQDFDPGNTCWTCPTQGSCARTCNSVGTCQVACL
jgi:hypothetical protein